LRLLLGLAGIAGHEFGMSHLCCKETVMFEIAISGATLIMDVDCVLTTPLFKTCQACPMK